MSRKSGGTDTAAITEGGPRRGKVDKRVKRRAVGKTGGPCCFPGKRR